jgi:SAM-dependent methyltransferase
MKNILVNEIFEWDVGNWSKSIHFWESNSQNDLQNCKALEIGARNGGLSLWLAKKGIQVVCSDIGFPTEKAIKKHEYYGVSDLIRYEKVNALQIPYENEFDIIIFKSVLGGIGRNNNSNNITAALENIHKALKPCGELLFVENLKGSPLHQFFRKKFVKWGNSWNYQSIESLIKSTSKFSSLKYQTKGFLGAFGPNEKTRKIFGKIDTFIFDRVTPQNWRYIFIGVAKK